MHVPRRFVTRKKVKGPGKCKSCSFPCHMSSAQLGFVSALARRLLRHPHSVLDKSPRSSAIHHIIKASSKSTSFVLPNRNSHLQACRSRRAPRRMPRPRLPPRSMSPSPRGTCPLNSGSTSTTPSTGQISMDWPQET